MKKEIALRRLRRRCLLEKFIEAPTGLPMDAAIAFLASRIRHVIARLPRLPRALRDKRKLTVRKMLKGNPAVHCLGLPVTPNMIEKEWRFAVRIDGRAFPVNLCGQTNDLRYQLRISQCAREESEQLYPIDYGNLRFIPRSSDPNCVTIECEPPEDKARRDAWIANRKHELLSQGTIPYPTPHARVCLGLGWTNVDISVSLDVPEFTAEHAGLLANALGRISPLIYLPDYAKELVRQGTGDEA